MPTTTLQPDSASLTDPPSLQLKAGTSELHKLAETTPQQRSLVQGTLPKEQFVAYLGQLFCIHTALEAHLCNARTEIEAFRKVVKDWQLQVPYLLEDLQFYEVDHEGIQHVEPVRACIESIDKYAKESPLALLGMHYVLEGSNNGNRFIARAIRPAYGIEPGKGDRYLDPYGEEQRSRWTQFKQDLDASITRQEEVNILLEGAKFMFEAVTSLALFMMPGQNEAKQAEREY